MQIKIFVYLIINVNKYSYECFLKPQCQTYSKYITESRYGQKFSKLTNSAYEFVT